jgi:hypothetical protein
MVLATLENSALGTAMRESPWLFPLVEIAHIFGFAVLVGAITMFDLRCLGVSRRTSARALAAHLVPWTLASLVIVVPSGVALFASRASEYFASPAFRVKLVLIALAGLNALAFHYGPLARVAEWDRDVTAPRAARVGAAISIACWLGVIAAGRLIAYV